jgi:hypothetical protein
MSTELLDRPSSHPSEGATQLAAAKAGARSLVLLLTLAGGISFAVFHFDGWFHPTPARAPIVTQVASSPNYAGSSSPVITIGFDAAGRPQASTDGATDQLQPLRSDVN